MSNKASTVHVSDGYRSTHAHEPLPTSCNGGKSLDCADSSCTEMMIIPTVYNSTLRTLYTLRLKFIRCCTVPLPFLPWKTPLIGGKTLIELSVMIVLTIVGIYWCLVAFTADKAGVITGNVAATAFALGFKNNVLTLVFGISYERAIFWHKFAAILWMVFGLIHGIRETPVLRLFHDSPNYTGLMMLCMGGLSMTLYIAHRFIPRYEFKYEWFYTMHVLLFVAIVITAYFHHALQVLYVGCIWTLDLFLRYVLTMHTVTAQARLLPGNVVRITMPRPFAYTAGQFCFLMVPSVTLYQFHPFSCSSAPHEEKLTFHIRVVGDWTRALYQHVSEQLTAQGKPLIGDDATSSIELKVCVEGPLGYLTLDLNNDAYKVVLLVAGGIGVTPTQSILNTLVYKQAHGIRKFSKVLMVWAVKDNALVDQCDVLAAIESGSASQPPQEQLEPRPQSPASSHGQPVLPMSFQPDLVELTNIPRRVEEIQQSGVGSPSPPAGVPGTARENDYGAIGESDKDKGSSSITIMKPSSPTSPMKEEDLLARFASNRGLANGVVFQGEFYLTNIRDRKDYSAAGINPDSQPYLTIRRPNLPDIVNRVASYVAERPEERGTHVAVVVCGPPSMVSELHDLCSHRHHGVWFDFHHETFQL